MPDVLDDVDGVILTDIPTDVAREEGAEIQQQCERERTASTEAAVMSEEAKPLSAEEKAIEAGFQKIRKLDSILEQAVRREREAKQRGQLLRRRIATELKELLYMPRQQSLSIVPKDGCAAGSRRFPTDIERNIRAFLALQDKAALTVLEDDEGFADELSTLHAEHADEDPLPESHLFETELHEELLQEKFPVKSTEDHHHRSNRCRDANNSSEMDSEDELEDHAYTWIVEPHKAVKGEANFIKRNIELCAKAGELMPFTREEELRLQGLLADIDEDDNPKEDMEGLAGTQQISTIPVDLQWPGRNFLLSVVEHKGHLRMVSTLAGTENHSQTLEAHQALEAIDRQLTSLQASSYSSPDTEEVVSVEGSASHGDSAAAHEPEFTDEVPLKNPIRRLSEINGRLVELKSHHVDDWKAFIYALLLICWQVYQLAEQCPTHLLSALNTLLVRLPEP
ncbi:hypothetical protein AAHC03_018945 [Spirometra sp. Aus1]